jgi:hypothetical protein
MPRGSLPSLIDHSRIALIASPRTAEPIFVRSLSNKSVSCAAPPWPGKTNHIARVTERRIIHLFVHNQQDVWQLCLPDLRQAGMMRVNSC